MNTPLAYSIVPIAPSNSTSASGSTRRASAGEVMSASGETTMRCSHAGALGGGAHGGVLGLRVMHDHGGGALLGDELVRRGQLHAERLLGRQEREQLRVILEVGARAVSPRVPLAAAAGDPE